MFSKTLETSTGSALTAVIIHHDDSDVLDVVLHAGGPWKYVSMNLIVFERFMEAVRQRDGIEHWFDTNYQRSIVTVRPRSDEVSLDFRFQCQGSKAEYVTLTFPQPKLLAFLVSVHAGITAWRIVNKADQSARRYELTE